MALSKDEQALLDEMEAALTQEDPQLVNALRGTTSRKLHRRRAALAGVVFIVGISALLVGMNVHWTISVVGFVLMLTATVVAISAWQLVSPEDGQSSPASRSPKPKSGPSMMSRLEERYRRRQEGER